MRRRLITALLACAALLLSSCAMPEALRASSPAAVPDLRLLEWPAYQEAAPAAVTQAASDVLRVDLWLDASQVMGGINANQDSLYPHMSRKYREGGFHYRFGTQAGLYEDVLRCLLAAGEGSRVRVLRAGNERLPDEALSHLAAPGTDAMRSLRRDMLTVAIDPLPSLFSTFSGESMAGSFYELGTPMLHRIRTLKPSALENPALAGEMALALDRQLAAFETGSPGAYSAVGDDAQSPLLYALENLDLSRLSVIACDPAALRRLSVVSAEGAPVELARRLLRERGVFEAGLCVKLYALTLDYMGQMSSFASADLAEPLLWGRLDYSNKTHDASRALPMPRTLLLLAVGAPAQVDAYTAALEAAFAASEALSQPRGPDGGQLSYTQNGQTVVQQPFRFESRSLLVARLALPCYTQRSAGARLAAGDAPVSREGELPAVTLAPSADGAQPDRTLTLALPVDGLPHGAYADLASLSSAEAGVEAALLLSDTVPITQQVSEGQTIALRDTQYVFTRQDAAFASGALQSPFRVSGAALSEDGGTLTLTVSVDGSALRPGYYRVLLSADLAGAQVRWPSVPWVAALDASPSGAQVSAWEDFALALHAYDGDAASVPRQFQHAWGPVSQDGYHGLSIPDFPPVMRAPWLSELLEQLRAAAAADASPLVRYRFDVFVPAGAPEGGV